jgi:hypothetical protein
VDDTRPLGPGILIGGNNLLCDALGACRSLPSKVLEGNRTPYSRPVHLRMMGKVGHGQLQLVLAVPHLQERAEFHDAQRSG